MYLICKHFVFLVDLLIQLTTRVLFLLSSVSVHLLGRRPTAAGVTLEHSRRRNKKLGILLILSFYRINNEQKSSYRKNLINFVKVCVCVCAWEREGGRVGGGGCSGVMGSSGLLRHWPKWSTGSELICCVGEIDYATGTKKVRRSRVNARRDAVFVIDLISRTAWSLWPLCPPPVPPFTLATSPPPPPKKKKKKKKKEKKEEEQTNKQHNNNKNKHYQQKQNFKLTANLLVRHAYYSLLQEAVNSFSGGGGGGQGRGREREREQTIKIITNKITRVKESVVIK